VAWEQLVLDYEAVSEEDVSDNTKRAVIMNYAPEELKVHLQMNQNLVGTYEELKGVIVQYLMAKKIWRGTKG